MRTPMTGADGLFHVAGWYKIGSKTPVLGKKINIDGTRNVLELMRELHIPRGVYTSTLLVFSDTRGKCVDEATHYEGPWLSEYERTKWVAHTQIAEPMMKEGLPLVMMMPGLVYGPGDTSSVRDLLIQYLKRRLPISPQKTAYGWGHIEDIAEGHLLAMEKGRPGESYILAGPIHTLEQALALAEQITGIGAPRLHPSPALLRGLAPRCTMGRADPPSSRILSVREHSRYRRGDLYRKQQEGPARTRLHDTAAGRRPL
ncbi:MAG: NAD-dependent epimerase/dehydratase family protein [Candidatus Manganitrophus sp.]|nr:NAD-dependent epimerase/dehydratase family protein [Candidatus Manganitrophus sp.]